MYKSTVFIFLSLVLFSFGNGREPIYTNSNYSIEERVEDLLSRMTVEEKVAQMQIFHANKGIERGDDGQLVLSEDVKSPDFCLSDVGCDGQGSQAEGNAYVPFSRSRYIVRDPRFGRMSVTFGEDPYLTTEMVVSAV